MLISSLELGGAERVFLMLANELSKHTRVHLVTQRAVELKHLLAPQVRHHNLEASTRRQALYRLWRHLKKERPRALLCTLWSPIAMGVIAGRLAGVPVAIRPATVCPRPRGVAGFCWGWLFRRASRVIALNLELARQMMAHGVGQEAIDIIPNPLDLEAMDGVNAPPPLEGPYLLTAARLSREKDLVTMIGAFALLVERGYVGRLVVLGEGPERPRLEAEVERLGLTERILLPGARHPAWNWTRHCELYLSTSLREGMPNAVLEALCLGKTVVATDCPGGQAELLDYGRWGYLAPVGDAPRFADQVQRALANPLEAEPMRGLIRERHDLRTVGQRYLDSLRKASSPTSSLRA